MPAAEHCHTVTCSEIDFGVTRKRNPNSLRSLARPCEFGLFCVIPTCFRSSSAGIIRERVLARPCGHSSMKKELEKGGYRALNWKE